MVLKRFAVILIVISLLAFTLRVSGLEIKTDGIADEKIWLDAPTQVLVSAEGNSNNAVTFAVTSCVYDEETNRAYLLFKVNTDTVIDSSTPHGLLINVDNSGFIGVSNNGVESYDTAFYLIESGIYEYSNGAFCVEICLGVKLGLRSLERVEVMLVDGNGIPSNSYELSLPSLPSEETTTQFLYQTTAPTTSETTTNNTTRITTTKSSTTVSKTEKTTKQTKTTLAKTTTAKTTKAKTTKAKTTKAKTTAKVVTVYVTVTESVSTPNTETSAESTLVNEEQQTYKELKYAAVAGLIILIFGLCVIINMNNDKNKNK